MKILLSFFALLSFAACGTNHSSNTNGNPNPNPNDKSATQNDNACNIAGTKKASQALTEKTNLLFVVLKASDQDESAKVKAIGEFLSYESYLRATFASNCFSYVDTSYESEDTTMVSVQNPDALMDQREQKLKKLTEPGDAKRFENALPELYPLFFPSSEENPFEKTVAPDSKTDAQKLPAATAKAFKLKAKIDLSALSTSLIANEVKKYSSSDMLTAEPLTNWIQSLVQKTAFTDNKSYKVALEKSISSDDLVLNPSAITVADVFKSSKLTDRSGTLTFFLTLLPRFQTSKEFNHQNWVLIFEKGHVLPGFLTKEGRDWHLFGIEMTASGDGLKNYGLTKALDQPIRVVDATLALQVIAKEPLYSVNSTIASRVLIKALEVTGKRYGISTSKTEQKVALVLSESSVPNPLTVSTLFGFGSVEMPEGDSPRTTVNP